MPHSKTKVASRAAKQIVKDKKLRSHLRDAAISGTTALKSARKQDTLIKAAGDKKTQEQTVDTLNSLAKANHRYHSPKRNKWLLVLAALGAVFVIVARNVSSD